ncbi:Predicted ABC-type ATPase [Belliella pelovolcani]|uniref:Predicted ABC-type ATPase n=2 Tax=Belliella pelovolcani TaxID=529505 RepID=A0A1N7Q720_9BACT|nr:Predicted ABC-type ATPase [Belliella pelovolcani]
MSKKFRMFSGPNGSGKSTLIQEVKKNYNVGFFINADEIEVKVNKFKFLDISEFTNKSINQNNWNSFLASLNTNDIRIKEEFPEIIISDKFLICKKGINSYQAAIMAEFFRNILLENEKTFSFETVMSHPSKVDFLKKAKQAGFSTYLYFICTQDPKINIQRIINRVVKGGHDVDQQKTVQRYYRSLELLYDAFMISDRAFVIDSSNRNRDVIVEKNKNIITIHNQNIPEWIAKYLLNKLDY